MPKLHCLIIFCWVVFFTHCQAQSNGRYSTFEDNTDRIGYDDPEGPYPAIDAHACAAQCLPGGFCQAWTWVPPGLCHIKFGVPGATAASGLVSGYIRPIWTYSTYDALQDRLGSDIAGSCGQLSGGNAMDCMKNCKGNSNCLSWAWVQSSNRCCLKYAVPNLSSNLDVISGKIDCPPGMIIDSSSNTCFNCGSDTYQSGRICINCPAGMGSVPGSTTCIFCAAGKYINSGYCADCAAGTFSASSSSTTCTPCPNGYDSPPGSASCPFVNMCIAKNPCRYAGRCELLYIASSSDDDQSYSCAFALEPISLLNSAKVISSTASFQFASVYSHYDDLQALTVGQLTFNFSGTDQVLINVKNKLGTIIGTRFAFVSGPVSVAQVKITLDQPYVVKDVNSVDIVALNTILILQAIEVYPFVDTSFIAATNYTYSINCTASISANATNANSNDLASFGGLYGNFTIQSLSYSYENNTVMFVINPRSINLQCTGALVPNVNVQSQCLQSMAMIRNLSLVYVTQSKSTGEFISLYAPKNASLSIDSAAFIVRLLNWNAANLPSTSFALNVTEEPPHPRATSTAMKLVHSSINKPIWSWTSQIYHPKSAIPLMRTHYFHPNGYKFLSEDLKLSNNELQSFLLSLSASKVNTTPCIFIETDIDTHPDSNPDFNAGEDYNAVSVTCFEPAKGPVYTYARQSNLLQNRSTSLLQKARYSTSLIISESDIISTLSLAFRGQNLHMQEIFTFFVLANGHIVEQTMNSRINQALNRLIDIPHHGKAVQLIRVEETSQQQTYLIWIVQASGKVSPVIFFLNHETNLVDFKPQTHLLPVPRFIHNVIVSPFLVDQHYPLALIDIYGAVWIANSHHSKWQQIQSSIIFMDFHFMDSVDLVGVASTANGNIFAVVNNDNNFSCFLLITGDSHIVKMARVDSNFLLLLASNGNILITKPQPLHDNEHAVVYTGINNFWYFNAFENYRGIIVNQAGHVRCAQWNGVSFEKDYVDFIEYRWARKYIYNVRSVQVHEVLTINRESPTMLYISTPAASLLFQHKSTSACAWELIEVVPLMKLMTVDNLNDAPGSDPKFPSLLFGSSSLMTVVLTNFTNFPSQSASALSTDYTQTLAIPSNYIRYSYSDFNIHNPNDIPISSQTALALMYNITADPLSYQAILEYRQSVQLADEQGIQIIIDLIRAGLVPQFYNNENITSAILGGLVDIIPPSTLVGDFIATIAANTSATLPVRTVSIMQSYGLVCPSNMLFQYLNFTSYLNLTNNNDTNAMIWVCTSSMSIFAANNCSIMYAAQFGYKQDIIARMKHAYYQLGSHKLGRLLQVPCSMCNFLVGAETKNYPQSNMHKKVSILAMGNYRDSSSIPVLLQYILDDTDAESAQAAIRALTKFPPNNQIFDILTSILFPSSNSPKTFSSLFQPTASALLRILQRPSACHDAEVVKLTQRLFITIFGGQTPLPRAVVAVTIEKIFRTRALCGSRDFLTAMHAIRLIEALKYQSPKTDSIEITGNLLDYSRTYGDAHVSTTLYAQSNYTFNQYGLSAFFITGVDAEVFGYDLELASAGAFADWSAGGTISVLAYFTVNLFDIVPGISAEYDVILHQFIWKTHFGIATADVCAVTPPPPETIEVAYRLSRTFFRLTIMEGIPQLADVDMNLELMGTFEAKYGVQLVFPPNGPFNLNNSAVKAYILPSVSIDAVFSGNGRLLILEGSISARLKFLQAGIPSVLMFNIASRKFGYDVSIEASFLKGSVDLAGSAWYCCSSSLCDNWFNFCCGGPCSITFTKNIFTWSGYSLSQSLNPNPHPSVCNSTVPESNMLHDRPVASVKEDPVIDFVYNCQSYPQVCENVYCWLKYYYNLPHFEKIPVQYQIFDEKSGVSTRKKNDKVRGVSLGTTTKYQSPAGYDRDEFPQAAWQFVLDEPPGCHSRIQSVPKIQNKAAANDVNQKVLQMFDHKTTRTVEFTISLPNDWNGPTESTCCNSDLVLNANDQVPPHLKDLPRYRYFNPKCIKIPSKQQVNDPEFSPDLLDVTEIYPSAFNVATGKCT